MSLKNIIINDTWYFWEFGWKYIPELLLPTMNEIIEAFFSLKKDKIFLNELNNLYKNYVGRPSPLFFCENLSHKIWWAKIYIKNEGLNHTGAHKINHCVLQALLAKHLGKKRIIAETWAGQHGLATASICAKLWLECTIYMWKKDYDRQRPNVYYMELAWAKVIPVYEWWQTLKDSVNAALKDLINNSHNSYYLLGTACWPAPYPAMNVFFQKIIGEEVKIQIKEQEWVLPDYLVACVWGWSNSQWLFYEFLDDRSVKMIWVEAGGKWIKRWKHAARFQDKKIWVAEWFKSYFLQNKDGQIEETSSISAWLDYAWVSPQLAYLESIWRVSITYATDKEALSAVQILMETEGVLPALESAHAIAETIKLAKKVGKNKTIVCNLSGRWDKDLFITGPKLDKKFIPFLKEITQ